MAGSLYPLGFAPFGYWVVTLLSMAAFAFILNNPKASSLTAFFYGLGLFGSGASWVYVSIHDYGYTSVALATILTGLFVTGLAIAFWLPFYLYRRLSLTHYWHHVLAFPAFWVLGEWSRSWLLTGFPWLYAGYAASDTALVYWAPLLGVWGISLLLAIAASALSVFAQNVKNLSIIKPAGLTVLVLAMTSPFAAGFGLQKTVWTQASSTKPVTFTLVQANIPQEKKWQPEYLGAIKTVYKKMTEPHWSSDFILWPEAAVPQIYQQALPWLQHMQNMAQEHNSTILTGIPSAIMSAGGPTRYHNSIVSLGETTLASSPDQPGVIYHKQRMVPFGEYLPLAFLLGDLVDIFNLPIANFSPGEKQQAPLFDGKIKIAPSICYEIVYPDLVARMASKADVLITISNDSWFGESIGPLQHLQMAQMRALENGRYLVRATNNGVSAVIGPNGKILAKTRQFKEETLTHEVYAMAGQTPFQRWGSWPVIVLCFLVVASLLAANLPARNKQPS